MKTFLFSSIIVASLLGNLLKYGDYPPVDPTERVYPIYSTALSSSAQWLGSCRLEFVALRGVAGGRTYGLLTITPLVKLPFDKSPATTVQLTGFDSRESIKPMVLPAIDFKGIPAGQYYAQLLDFGIMNDKDFLPGSDGPVKLTASSETQ